MAALWLTLALLGQVEAQMPDRIYRLGILATDEAAIETWRAATLPELARLGFSERRNLFLDAGTSPPAARALERDRSLRRRISWSRRSRMC